MTADKYKKQNIITFLKSAAAFITFLSVSFFMSDEISKYAYDGLSLSLKVIIPTVFPFMLLSDFSDQAIEFEKSRFIGNIFERAFRISRIGLGAFFSGILGGFPIGAKNAISLYDDGKISKSECERLLSFSNIPSIAYVISAVGMGMLGSLRCGILLYLATLISAIITGVILGIKRNYSQNTTIITKQKYSFVNSTKSAALGSLNIAFFVCAFSVLCGLIRRYFKSYLFCAHILPFFEVSNASSYLSDLCIFSLKQKMIFISFALSFSGLSVVMQSLSFIKSKDISFSKCLFYKLLHGIISSLIILTLPI